MRFMMMVKATKDSEAGVPPSPELTAAIGELAEEGVKAGVLVDMEELAPTSQGARVRVARGKVSVTDGPFTEAKELVGGYAIIETKSKAEAIEIGKDLMKLHGDVLGPSYEGEVEIRQLVGPPDVGPT